MGEKRTKEVEEEEQKLVNTKQVSASIYTVNG